MTCAACYPKEPPTMPEALSIVMIEDDEGHARLIEKNIRRAGVKNEIIGFETGEGALEHLLGAESHDIRRGRSVILLDLNLPDMTGLYVLKRLKADQRTRKLPVFVLTTTDDKSDIEKCYDLGANAYITKPLDYDAFAYAIRQLGLFLSVIQTPVLE
jgi:CheY-like chemotaxis protein